MRALAAWRPARFDIDLDGERVSFRGYGVAAANNKAYGGGMYCAPAAELDDGLVDVVWMEEVSKLRFLFSVLPRVFKGTHVELDEVKVRRAREVSVSADRPFTVYADGDPLADLPTRITLLPRALRVLHRPHEYRRILPASAASGGPAKPAAPVRLDRMR